MGLNTVIESLECIPLREAQHKELVEGCKVKPVFHLEELTGIKNRPVVADNEYALDLAGKRQPGALKSPNISRRISTWSSAPISPATTARTGRPALNPPLPLACPGF